MSDNPLLNNSPFSTPGQQSYGANSGSRSQMDYQKMDIKSMELEARQAYQQGQLNEDQYKALLSRARTGNNPNAVQKLMHGQIPLSSISDSLDDVQVPVGVDISIDDNWTPSMRVDYAPDIRHEVHNPYDGSVMETIGDLFMMGPRFYGAISTVASENTAMTFGDKDVVGITNPTGIAGGVVGLVAGAALGKSPVAAAIGAGVGAFVGTMLDPNASYSKLADAWANRISVGDVIVDNGVNPYTALTTYNGGDDDPYGSYGWAVGLTGDIGTDPLTYLSFGRTAGARILATPQVAGAISQAAPIGSRIGAYVSSGMKSLLGKSDEIAKMTKVIDDKIAALGSLPEASRAAAAEEISTLEKARDAAKASLNAGDSIPSITLSRTGEQFFDEAAAILAPKFIAEMSEGALTAAGSHISDVAMARSRQERVLEYLIRNFDDVKARVAISTGRRIQAAKKSFFTGMGEGLQTFGNNIGGAAGKVIGAAGAVPKAAGWVSEGVSKGLSKVPDVVGQALNPVGTARDAILGKRGLSKIAEIERTSLDDLFVQGKDALNVERGIFNTTKAMRVLAGFDPAIDGLDIRLGQDYTKYGRGVVARFFDAFSHGWDAPAEVAHELRLSSAKIESEVIERTNQIVQAMRKYSPDTREQITAAVEARGWLDVGGGAGDAAIYSDEIEEGIKFVQDQMAEIEKYERAAGIFIDGVEGYISHIYKGSTASKIALSTAKNHGVFDVRTANRFSQHRAIATIEEGMDLFGQGKMITDAAQIVSIRWRAAISAVEKRRFADWVGRTQGLPMQIIAEQKTGIAKQMIASWFRRHATGEEFFLNVDQVFTSPGSPLVKLGFKQAIDQQAVEYNAELMRYLMMPSDQTGRFSDEGRALADKLGVTGNNNVVAFNPRKPTGEVYKLPDTFNVNLKPHAGLAMFDPAPITSVPGYNNGKMDVLTAMRAFSADPADVSDFWRGILQNYGGTVYKDMNSNVMTMLRGLDEYWLEHFGINFAATMGHERLARNIATAVADTMQWARTQQKLGNGKRAAFARPKKVQVETPQSPFAGSKPPGEKLDKSMERLNVTGDVGKKKPKGKTNQWVKDRNKRVAAARAKSQSRKPIGPRQQYVFDYNNWYQEPGNVNFHPGSFDEPTKGVLDEAVDSTKGLGLPVKAEYGAVAAPKTGVRLPSSATAWIQSEAGLIADDAGKLAQTSGGLLAHKTGKSLSEVSDEVIGVGSRPSKKKTYENVNIEDIEVDELVQLVYDDVYRQSIELMKKLPGTKNKMFHVIDVEPQIPQELIDGANMARSRAGVTVHLTPPTQKEIDEVREMMIALGFEGPTIRKLSMHTVGKEFPETQQELEILREAVAPYFDETLAALRNKAGKHQGESYDIFGRGKPVVVTMEFEPRAIKNEAFPNILNQDLGIPSSFEGAGAKAFHAEDVMPPLDPDTGRVLDHTIGVESVVGKIDEGMDSVYNSERVGAIEPSIASPIGHGEDAKNVYPAIASARKEVEESFLLLKEKQERLRATAQEHQHLIGNGKGAAKTKYNGKEYESKNFLEYRRRTIAARDQVLAKLFGKNGDRSGLLYAAKDEFDNVVKNGTYADVKAFVFDKIEKEVGFDNLARALGHNDYNAMKKAGADKELVDAIVGSGKSQRRNSMSAGAVRGRIRGLLYRRGNELEDLAAKAETTYNNQVYVGFDGLSDRIKETYKQTKILGREVGHLKGKHSIAEAELRKAERLVIPGGMDDVAVNVGRGDIVKRAKAAVMASERAFAEAMKLSKADGEVVMRFIKMMDDAPDHVQADILKNATVTLPDGKALYFNASQLRALKAMTNDKSAYRHATIAKKNIYDGTIEHVEEVVRGFERNARINGRYIMGLIHTDKSAAMAALSKYANGADEALESLISMAPDKAEEIKKAAISFKENVVNGRGYASSRMAQVRAKFGEKGEGIFQGLKQNDYTPQGVQVVMPDSVAVLIEDYLRHPNSNRGPTLQRFLRFYDGVQSMFKTSMLSPFAGYWARNGFSNAMLTSANLFARSLRDEKSGVAVETANLMTYMLAKESAYLGDDAAKIIEKVGAQKIVASNGREVTVAEMFERMQAEGVIRGHAHAQIVSEGPVKRLSAAALGGGIGLMGGATAYAVGDDMIGDGVKDRGFDVATLMTTVAGAYLGYRKPSGAVRTADEEAKIAKSWLSRNGAGLPIIAPMGRTADKVTGFLQTNLKSVVHAGELATDAPFRIANYVNEFKLTGSHYKAANQTFDTLNDWNNLSSFEREVMRRMVPFYGWSKFAINHTVQSALERPGLIANELRTAEWWNKAYDMDPNEVPDHLHTSVFFATQSESYKGEGRRRKKVTMTQFYSGLGLPIEDATKIADALVGNSPFMSLASRGPFGVTPALELLFNRSTFSGDPISSPVEVTRDESGRSWETAPSWVQAIVGYKPRTKDSDPMVDPEFAFAMGDAPWSRFMHVAKSVYRMDDEKVAKADYRTLATSMLGPGVFYRDSETGQYYANKRRIDIMAARLEAIGRIRRINKNVDVNKKDRNR